MSVHAPVRLAGRTLKPSNHVCAFFYSRQEQDKVLMPFFRDGVERGEKLFHIIDPDLDHEHRCSCQAHGIDVEAAEDDGQLEIRHWADAYLWDGYFDGDRMIRTLEEVVETNRPKYGLTRLMGNMEWALTTVPGVTDVIEYETKLNYVLPRYPDPVICVYDLNRHSGSVVMDVLRTHPMVIIGGVLQENPLYVPPDRMLETLQARKVKAQRSAEELAPSTGR